MKNELSYGLTILSTLHFSQVAAQSQPAKPLDYIVVPPGGGYQLGTGSWKLRTHQTGGSIAICEFNSKGDGTPAWFRVKE